MLTKTDFIRIPYTPDLSSGGIAYACRSLPHTYNRMGGSSIKRMRRIVGGVAVELAFRRYLSEKKIPFDVKGATPFTDPDKYDVSLGGRRCDLKSFFITRRSQIKAIARDLGVLTGASALIPSDQFAGSHHKESDVYIFAFLTGLNAASQNDMAKAMDAGKQLHLIHPLPKNWAKPKYWHPLGQLSLKSDCDETLKIELGGQDIDRNFISEQITLEPRKRIWQNASLYTLAYIHVDKMPHARIGVHSPKLGETYVISSNEWGNIWFYGMSVILTGYLTRAQFRQKASKLPAGSRVYQYSKTQTKNLAVPVAELNPLDNFFEKIKAWKK